MAAPAAAIDHTEIVKELGLEKFVDQQWDLIAQRLVRALEVAEKTPVDTNLSFIAESLPLINGIINVGSTFETVQRVEEKVPRGGDPLIVLSALVFRYVADKGVQEAQKALAGGPEGTDPRDKKKDLERWETIRKRAYALLKDRRP